MDELLIKCQELATMIETRTESGGDSSQLLSLFSQFQGALLKTTTMESKSSIVDQAVSPGKCKDEATESLKEGEIALDDAAAAQSTDPQSSSTIIVNSFPLRKSGRRILTKRNWSGNSDNEAILPMKRLRSGLHDTTRPEKRKQSIMPRKQDVLLVRCLYCDDVLAVSDLEEHMELTHPAANVGDALETRKFRDLTSESAGATSGLGEEKYQPEQFWCKLCEVKDMLTAAERTLDSISKATHSLADNQAVTTSVNSAASSDPANGDDRIIFPDQYTLTNHLREAHAIFDADAMIKDQVTLLNSQLVNKSGKVLSLKQSYKYYLFACPRCSKRMKIGNSFLSGYNRLQFHLHCKHNDDLPPSFHFFTCRVCDYRTHSKKLLRDHMKYQHENDSGKNRKKLCDLCGKWIMESYMNQHRASKHQDAELLKLYAKEVIPCSICGKILNGKYNLERHLKRVHEKVRDFLCHLCSAQYSEKKDLHAHVFSKHNINITNRPILTCKVPGCTFQTISLEFKKKHDICHQEERRVMCRTCGKAFKTAAMLKQHTLVMHSKESKYQCQHCSFVSHAKQYLHRHMVIHSDTKRYKCTEPDCSYQSHFLENVKKHTKSMHAKSPQLTKPKTSRRNVKKPLQPKVPYELTTSGSSSKVSVNGIPVTTVYPAAEHTTLTVPDVAPVTYCTNNALQTYSPEVQQLINRNFVSL